VVIRYEVDTKTGEAERERGRREWPKDGCAQ